MSLVASVCLQNNLKSSGQILMAFLGNADLGTRNR